MIDDKRLQEIGNEQYHDDNLLSITVDEIISMAQELQTLREQVAQYEIIVQGKCDELGKLHEQNKALIEDAERLAKSVLNSWKENGSGDKPEVLDQHNALMQEING